jgi:hypothetical protein
MPTINLAKTGHGNKTEAYADGSSIDYWEFPEATKQDKARLKKIERAINILDRLNARIDLGDPCNVYFKKLPKGKSFRSLWTDATIFIDYSPSVEVGLFAATHSNDKDVALTKWCLDNKNHWMVAATLVHEFAHIGGAPGGASKDAEKAADECYFDPQYDPTIMGSLDRLGQYLQGLG